MGASDGCERWVRAMGASDGCERWVRAMGAPRPAPRTFASSSLVARSPALAFDIILYFCNYRNIYLATSKKSLERVAKYADMFPAMGTEPRLRIMQKFMSAFVRAVKPAEAKSCCGPTCCND